LNTADGHTGLAHDVELTEDWSLWPQFAVRSAGFPVEGLEAFGPDEDAALAEVARNPGRLQGFIATAVG
jgi:hypothetical protein